MRIQFMQISFIGLILGSAGCAHAPIMQQKMNAEEIKAVSDKSLCLAYENYEKTPVMTAEVARRKIDCASIEAAKKAQLASKKQGGSTQAAAAGSGVAARRGAITCENPKTKNLTLDQAKALVYIIQQKTGYRRVGCIVELTANDKFPFQGLTMINYTANIVFPQGYKTDCLGINPGEFTGWNNYGMVAMGCNPMEYEMDPLGAPAPPGTIRTISGQDRV